VREANLHSMLESVACMHASGSTLVQRCAPDQGEGQAKTSQQSGTSTLDEARRAHHLLGTNNSDVPIVDLSSAPTAILNQ
jgi:hypothetical protein